MSTADEGAGMGGGSGSMSARNLAYRIFMVASALVVPAAYIFGRTYHDAWVKAAGFHPTLFPVALDEALFYAYVATAEGLSAILERYAPAINSFGKLWLVLIVSLFLLVLAWLKLSSLFSGFLVRLFRNPRRAVIDNIYTRSFAFAYVVASAPVLLVGAALYLALIALLPALAGEKVGGSVGSEFRREALSRLADEDFLPHHRFTRIKGCGANRINLVVKCNGSGCAVLSVEGAEFVVWDNLDGIRGAP